MRIVYCWFDISGYMGACWRALARRPGVTLKVIAFAPQTSGIAPFSPEVLSGVEHELLDDRARHDHARIAASVATHRPDVVVICGWAHAPYVRLLRAPELASARFAMTMDTPWRGTLRQRLGRFKLRPIAARLDWVVVSGERSWQLARNLDIPESKIRRGCYGIDDDVFRPAFEKRSTAPAYPRRFLFTGSYDLRKGLDVILDAYTVYRSAVSDPWPLTCSGRGELAGQVSATPGVTDRGFTQPASQAALYADHGAFVIASRFDPWPLAIVEAAAAGLPIICSESCGSAVEIVRPYYSGLTCPTGDPAALTRALRWLHDHPELLAEMGHRGRQFALAYTADVWATRVVEMIREAASPTT